MLVAIADQQLEIRVDHRCLIAIRHLKCHRLDTIGLVGFRLFFGVVGRIDEVQFNHPARGDLVFAQHVLDTRDQRSQQRVGSLAEIPADQERFRQAAQHIPRRLRKAVFSLCGQINPQSVERVKPDIQCHQVGTDQHSHHHHPPPVPLRLLPPAPPLAVQRQHVQRQKEPCQREIVHQVAQVDHPAFDTLEATAGTHRSQDPGRAIADKTGHAA